MPGVPEKESATSDAFVPRLPTGTVTFFFSDVEGSTRLATELGTAGWQPLLERHRELLRTALAEAGGVEVGTEGDGTFAVFDRPSAAVEAAARAQRLLDAEAWPEGARVRIRIGLHTGEGLLDAEGSYVGLDVHRASRIAAAAHGGEVLLSETTRSLVADHLGPALALRDLGEHRLKDLRPERLWQLLIEGLPTDFPPVRSLDRRPNNLPTQLTSFIGREKELAATSALLAESRLLTLTGPGGTGKTRLALQLAAAVADRFEDGVYFVPLEPIRTAELVAAAVARVLGAIETPGRSAVEILVEAVGERRILFVLDNFEQIVEASPVVAELLRRCPNVSVVATSRATLRISGEREFPVPGLPAPPDTSRLSVVERENLPVALAHPDPGSLSQYEAVRLFIARAVAARPGFSVTNENAPAVAQICARLQGMPLAIELAAARVRLLSPDEILRRLERQLGLLTSGARDLPPRQQTLRGAIAWSYDLVAPGCRRLLDRLSVFRGGVDLEAAEAVCGPAEELGIDVFDGLASLVEQSLVRSEERGETSRFDLLEAIREYAAEMLAAAGEAEEIRVRHLRWFRDLAETAAPHLAGANQRHWLDRLEVEHDNLRAAIDGAVERGDAESAARLGFALWRFWQQRGYLNEARMRLEAMDGIVAGLPPPLLGRFYEALGGVAYWQADAEAAAAAYDRALAIWREVGDRREMANALYNRGVADIVGVIGELAQGVMPEQVERGRTRLEEGLAIYRELGDRVGEANLLWALGAVAYFTNDLSRAIADFRAALDGFRQAGQRTMEAWSLHMLGRALLKLGVVDEARATLRHALHLFHEAGDLAGVILCLDDLSAQALVDGDLPRAGRLRGGARKLERTVGTRLASWVEESFEAATRPTARRALDPGELERYAAEGAAMPLDDLVAYALGTGPEADSEPAEPGPSRDRARPAAGG